MIYTVTLNPAIDKTIKINDFRVNQVNRVTDQREDAGGKGINVSKMIRNFKGDTVAVMITGGPTGQHLVDLLDQDGIPYKTVATDGQTRINTKVVDHENHTFTDINEPGPEVSESTLVAIDDYLKTEMKANDILVLAGSLPKGVPTDIYKHWCELGREVGAKVILDADGEVFEKGLEGIPFIIKPNQAELEMHFNETFTDEGKMIEKVQSILDTGVYGVIISQGSEGCLMVTKEGVVKYNSLKVKVVSTVGAGDSMVAAIAYGLDEVLSDDEVLNLDNMMDILRLGVAASSASIEQEGTHMGGLQRVNELYQEVVIAHKTINS